MEEVTLRAVKRSMPGKGRARIHASLLSTIGIADKEDMEIIAPDGTLLTLTAFADSLVEIGQIRISEEDLKNLRIENNTDVKVRRKIPVTEQAKVFAGVIADRLAKGVQDLGGAVSGKAGELRVESEQVVQTATNKAKEVSSKISEQVGPAVDKIEEAGREAAAKIHELVPTARFSTVVEATIKKLSPGDASELKKILLTNEGDICVVTISKDIIAGRTIQNLTFPPGVTIAAIQRADNSLVIPTPETILAIGDVVYLIGKDKGLTIMTGILEG
ncbi:MAG TPA: TrkA C-terminal domain-containing protein [Methanospirillum sp.]|nr:TrkA C-terminal domain-containing protein [Methanospirillum sp.]